jgi:O-antigen ligase
VVVATERLGLETVRFEGLFASRRIAIALERLTFCSLLGLIVLMAAPYGGVEPKWEGVFECSVFGLTALWIIEGLLSGSWQLRRLAWLAPLFLVIVWIWAQTGPSSHVVSLFGIRAEWPTLSADPYETRLVALKATALGLFLLLILRQTRTYFRLFALINVVIGTGVATALFGIIRRAAQTDGQPFVLEGLLPGVGFGQFINPNHFAFLIEMSFGLACCAILGSQTRRELKVLYLSASILLGVALVLTNSRGGILSFLGEIGFIGVALAAGWFADPHKRHRRKTRNRLWGAWAPRVMLVLLLLFMIWTGILWLGGDRLAQRLDRLPNEVAASREGNRWAIWKATWQMIKDHPLRGTGFGAYKVVIPQYQDSSGQEQLLQAHNDYLELLASGGMIAFSLAMLFGASFVRQGMRVLKTGDMRRRAVTYGAFAGLIGVAIHSFFDFGAHITVNAVLMCALIAIAAAEVHNSNWHQASVVE